MIVSGGVSVVEEVVPVGPAVDCGATVAGVAALPGFVCTAGAENAGASRQNRTRNRNGLTRKPPWGRLFHTNLPVRASFMRFSAYIGKTDANASIPKRSAVAKLDSLGNNVVPLRQEGGQLC